MIGAGVNDGLREEYRPHNASSQAVMDAERMSVWAFDHPRLIRHGVSEYDWPLFQFAIARPSLYVLGAGASLPILGGDFASEIRRAVWRNGMYSAVSELPSPLKQSLLPYDEKFEVEAMLDGSISQNELDRHTPNAQVEILLARRLTVASPVRPVQYEVFDRVAPSVLLNFNNDNLAYGVHPKHLCLRPHGIIDPKLVHSLLVDQAMEVLGTVPDLWIERLDYHRPLPEPGDITNRRAYRLLPRCFEALHAVVVIGYSFGARQDGSIHDAESFELIVDLLRWRPKPVLVVGPEPETVAARLEAGIRRRVSILPCKWNVLARFVANGFLQRSYARSRRRDSWTFMSRYWAYEERLDLLETATRTEID